MRVVASWWEVANTASTDFSTVFSVTSNQLDQDPSNNSMTVVTELDAPPEQVTNLSSPSSGGDFIKLSWTVPADNGSPISGYELERKDDNDVYLPVSPPPDAAVTAYRDESVATGTTYTYRLRAVNEDSGRAGGHAEWSNEVTATAEVKVTTITTGGGGGGGGGGTPANRPPRITGEDRPIYAENGTGQVVTYTVEDPDGDDIVWSLEGSDSRHMEISQDGTLSFKEPPDYETPIDSRFDNTYEVTLRATDDGSPPEDDIHRVRVTVTNVNEVGPISGDAEVAVEENFAGQIAQYMAEDPERNTVTWSLSGPDAAFFEIDQDGNLSLLKELDFEVKSSTDMSDVYKVTVVATDDGRPAASSPLDVVVKVSDVEEAPKSPLCAWVSFILEWATPDDADGLGTQSTLWCGCAMC